MNDILNQFKQILKKKGTGKTMSKHMDKNDIRFVANHFRSDDIPLSTKSTLLTAWIMLDKTPDEEAGLSHLIYNKEAELPRSLHYLITPNELKIDTIIHEAMAGNEIPKITIQSIFKEFFDGKIPDYKLASFLEALRLKEETFQENTTIFDIFRQQTEQTILNVPLLLDMATPYDGFNRSYFLQPFVCALLAAAGIPSIIHGVREVSPKKGMNTHKILLEANKNPMLSIDRIKSQIENTSIGWGYIDQSIFCPTLHQLIPLRVDMVKRPVLATIEKWLHPFKAEKTVCLTGFTHPPYKQKTLDIVDYAQSYEQLILVRGVEGSSLLPPDRRTPFITMSKKNKPNFDYCSPLDYNLEQNTIEDQDHLKSLHLGIAGLSGENKIIQHYLCYQVMAISNAINMPIDYSHLKELIESGKAIKHWKSAH